MTTIAAYVSPDGNNVSFGSDKMAIYNNSEKMALNSPKWVSHEGNAWAGFAGGLDYLTFVREGSFGRSIRNAAERSSTHLTKLLRGFAHESGHPPLNNVQEYNEGYENSGIIVVPEVGVWRVDSGLLAIPMAAGEYWATGSGRAYAMGAAYTAFKLKHDIPTNLVRRMLEAAYRFDPYTGGEFDIYNIDDKLKVEHTCVGI